MKRLFNKSVYMLIFLIATFIAIAFTNDNSSKKEVLIIKTYVSFETAAIGLAILHNDKPTEFIIGDQKSIYSSNEGEDVFKNMVEVQGRMLANTLQKFYANGWELEETVGGEMPIYILGR